MTRLAGAVLILAGTIALTGLAAIHTMRSLPEYLMLLGWVEVALGGYLIVRGDR